MNDNPSNEEEPFDCRVCNEQIPIGAWIAVKYSDGSIVYVCTVECLEKFLRPLQPN